MKNYAKFLDLFADNTLPTAFESNVSTLISETVTGYVLILENDTAILITPDPQPYSISKDLSCKYFLSSGDKITAGVVKSVIQCCVINIIKVNRQTDMPAGFTKHFDSITGVRSAAAITVNGSDINIGNTAMIVLNQNEKPIEKIRDTVSQCGSDAVKIALGLDGREENLNYLLQNGYHYGYLTTQNQSLKQQLMIVLISFFRAKELAESGKTAILAVYNLEKLLLLLNDAITASNQLDNTKITPNAIRDFTNIIHSSKMLESGGSLTVLGFFTANDTEQNKFLFNTFSNICDYVI
jgi:transcription termination factor Rho